jgi:hypothetical protein
VTRWGGLWSSLLAAKRRPTPQQIVAAEAETSSGAFIGALGLFQPTFALKLIIATEIFLDVTEDDRGFNETWKWIGVDGGIVRLFFGDCGGLRKFLKGWRLSWFDRFWKRREIFMEIDINESLIRR